MPWGIGLTNGSIIIRILSQNMPLCFYPSIAPLQANIELRTIQHNQPSSPTPEPSSQGYTYVVVTHIATTQPTKQCKTTWLVWYYYRLKKTTPHHHTTPHHTTTPGLITI